MRLTTVARCMFTHVICLIIREFSEKAWIDRSSLKDITVNSGDNVKIIARVGGEPPPEVIWSRKDVSIHENSRCNIAITETNTSLEMGSAVRDDSGQYQLTVVNPLGKDTASVMVTVLGEFF